MKPSRHMDIIPLDAHPPRKDQEAAMLRTLHNGGWSIDEIADELKMPSRLVFIRLNCPVRPLANPTKAQH